jgi:type III restriction enzyme
VTEDVAEDQKRRIQIREVIRAHLDKERELFAQGIKVLSLFFIDEVAKYRDYDREDTLGEYARVFEEEYEAVLADHLGQLAIPTRPPNGTASTSSGIPVRRTHEGYFSIDKKTGHSVDGSVKPTGETAGQSDDVDAYDLILKDKERLLSFEEPVRFILVALGAARGLGQPQRLRHGHAQEERQHRLLGARRSVAVSACPSTSTASGWTTPSRSTTSTS